MSIGDRAFSYCDITEVISLIENPFGINAETFSDNTFYNATLYVPKGTIDKYKSTAGWKKFLFIEEGNGSGNNPPEPSKCKKPTINYQNGKLTFNCATEGAEYVYEITDSDVKKGYTNKVQLTATYYISVYATKTGYDNSDVATATLCWIEATPQTEGISNGIAQVPARAVMIQSNGGTLTIQGAEDGTPIKVYSVNGCQVGSAVSSNGQATVNTTLQSGSVAIVKIGERSVKVVTK